MQTKVVLEGTLFSECELMGANRGGMMRLAEEITQRLLLDNELDISFASTFFFERYDSALKKFIAEKYQSFTNKILTKNPPSLTNILKWKGIFKNTLVDHAFRTFYKDIYEKDIFHSFYYPFSKDYLKNNVKQTITLLDIIPLKLNGYPKSLVQITKNIVGSIEKNYAISISGFSKNDLLNYSKKVIPENVFVVPLAASKELFYENKNKNDWQLVKTKYSLPEKYFLCVSGAEPRKNILHVIKCFNKFILQEQCKDIFLVLTGNATHNNDMLNGLHLSKAAKDKICLPTIFIDSKDLAVLYSNAMCFFFMSLYEGFGLPALEAMQCGTATVASNSSSLPEVVGNGGILLRPTDEDALCDTMCKMYNNEEYRSEIAKAGLKKAATFSWEKTAGEYANIFKKLASNKS